MKAFNKNINLGMSSLILKNRLLNIRIVEISIDMLGHTSVATIALVKIEFFLLLKLLKPFEANSRKIIFYH